LSQPFVELANQETVEGNAVFEQPQERRPIHQGDPRIAERDEIVLANLVLQHGALTEPAARADSGQRDGLAAHRQRTQLNEAGDDADPEVETVAAVTDIGALRESLFDDPVPRLLAFVLGQILRPYRDAA
jgi:hypothetical protein